MKVGRLKSIFFCEISGKFEGQDSGASKGPSFKRPSAGIRGVGALVMRKQGETLPMEGTTSQWSSTSLHELPQYIPGTSYPQLSSVQIQQHAGDGSDESWEVIRLVEWQIPGSRGKSVEIDKDSRVVGARSTARSEMGVRLGKAPRVADYHEKVWRSHAENKRRARKKPLPKGSRNCVAG